MFFQGLKAFRENVDRQQDKRMAAAHARIRLLRVCFAAILNHRLSRSQTRGKLSNAVLRLSNLAASQAFHAWRSSAQNSIACREKVCVNLAVSGKLMNF
jgi:hypothetical protein